jgi:hypothetical protein
MKRVCIVLAVMSSAGLPAACGGDDSASKGPPGSADNPLVALPNPTGTRTPPTDKPLGEPSVTAKASDKRGGTLTPHKAGSSKTATGSSDAKAPATLAPHKAPTSTGHGARKQKRQAPSAAHPCSLVTKSQARAILGTPVVEPLQAPQGPTCIYQSARGKQYVMLAVQQASLAKLRKQLSASRSVQVAGTTGYCGKSGRPMLYLPVSSGRVLSVAAACNIATRFAAKAAPHL